MDFFITREELREFIFKQTLFIILYITLEHVGSLSDSHPWYGRSIMEWNIDQVEASTL